MSDDALAALLDEAPPEVHSTRLARVDELRPHPRNYRSHPEDQRKQIARSVREHGFYRNVVAARDGTILAGHGVVETARDLGLDEVPVVFLDVDPDSPRALRVLAGDNTLALFAVDDDRALAELLKGLNAEADGLLGTGFDEAMVANLAMVTRSAEELADFDAAAEWVGMPEFVPGEKRLQLVLAFDSEEERDALVERLGVTIAKKTRGTWSAWFPPRERADLDSLLYEG